MRGRKGSGLFSSTLKRVLQLSHSNACGIHDPVIIEHPFWGAAEQVVVLYVPNPFLPRVAVMVGKGSGYARGRTNLVWLCP